MRTKTFFVPKSDVLGEKHSQYNLQLRIRYGIIRQKVLEIQLLDNIYCGKLGRSFLQALVKAPFHSYMSYW